MPTPMFYDGQLGPEIRAKFNELGDLFQAGIDGLLSLQQRYEQIGDVRGRGLLLGLEFVADRRTKKPDNALGGRVEQTPDGLRITPVPLRGGVFHTYADHRMAHAGALLGLAVGGVRLDDVTCTTKTLPDFPGLWATLVGRG